MNEFKGTPGPWVRGNINHFHAEYITAEGMEGAICSVLPTEETEEGWQRGYESQANAALIVAAPQLLEALQLMVSTYPYSPPCHGWESQVEAHVAAKQAIAKALGK